LQIGCAYLLRSTPIFSWPFFLTAYIVGATANQNTFLAIHEISHNLAFRSAYANRLFAIFANLPIGLPYSAAFRPYHLTHHKALGVDGLDTDLPTKFEAIFLDSVLGKAFFCTFQILFYALRPMMVLTLPFTGLHFLNLVVQLGFDAILVWSCGWNSLAYLIMSSFLAGSLHPCAGHFIAEHVGFSYLLPKTPNSLGKKGKILNQTYITNLFSMSSRNLSTHLPKTLFPGRQCQLKLTPIMAV
jgi:sphingolipid delta-4 desaturase